MAINEGIRKTSEAIVVSMCPDVCLTPVGKKDVPVPYEIFARFDTAQSTAPKVLIHKKETLNEAAPRRVACSPRGAMQ